MEVDQQVYTKVKVTVVGRSLTHCTLMDSSTVICWMSPFFVLGVSGLFCCIFDGNFILLANNTDPDQTSHYVASDLGQHSLPMSLLWVFR